MLSRFFIERPIFAWVIAIGIMMGGIAAIFQLPIGQYPNIAPPAVRISANYPGASAEAVESSITQVLEQQLTGIDGLMYFSSTSSSSGQGRITVNFEKGTDPDTAQVQTQNRIQQAIRRLPAPVQQQGVVVEKTQDDFLVLVGLYDKSGRSTRNDIADFLVNNFQDPISRIEGVGSVNIFGAPYAMRIWLDPYKLASVKLMPSDIRSAIQAQNVEVTAGEIGDLPAPGGQQINATVTSRSRLETPEQFAKIIVKTQSDGTVVHLADVARVEMGSQSYGVTSYINGQPASGIAVMLAPGADALKTAELVKAKATELSGKMPDGYSIQFMRDTTPFIKLSIEEVVKTLVEAVILVIIVMFIFLQSWRATLIPAIAVPVVLLGTFGVLQLMGYSINTLTLFGMVLSIGLLVDDAIVVVENVERIMEEEGLSPKEATAKSMGEINGALIGIAVVLSAVMLPMAFFGGSTGVIYRQFSVTIISSMLLSVLVALILSPALCATLLQPRDAHMHEGSGMLARFNRWFNRVNDRYARQVGFVITRRRMFWGSFLVLLIVMWGLFSRLPTSFLPTEDQGQLALQYTLPAGTTADRTEAVADQIKEYILNDERDNANYVMTIIGFSFAGSGQNTGQGFVNLKPWEERKGFENSSPEISRRANVALSAIRDAKVLTTTPPAIQGLGQSNGFSFQLLNSGGLSRQEFKDAYQQLLKAAEKDPMLTAVRSGSLEDTPQLKIDIDSEKLSVLGLTQSDVDDVLSAAWGSVYVNDFIDRGRVKRVYMQADGEYRSLPEDINNWQVRNRTTGEMVPFSAFATTRWALGPATLPRFNGLPSYEVQGQAASGVSSGEAMARMIELQQQLPAGTSYAWSGLSFQEQRNSGQTTILYALSILVVFLCLAALYESWSIPLAVMLSIPVGVFGAVLAVTLRGLDNNIFFQVGLLTTMGLAAKNAILIVEFAAQAKEKGLSEIDAAIEAARLRFRPILMTSLAFVAGAIPLAIASGAGAQGRVAIGTAVVGGMIAATALAIFYVPLFFVSINARLARRKQAKDASAPEAIA